MRHLPARNIDESDAHSQNRLLLFGLRSWRCKGFASCPFTAACPRCFCFCRCPLLLLTHRLLLLLQHWPVVVGVLQHALPQSQGLFSALFSEVAASFALLVNTLAP